MKILVIPDPHGSDHWKTIESRVNEFDKIIFLGDYFDSFVLSYSRQMKNFKNILAFAAEHPAKIELCIGNHDLAYLSDQDCAGHQWSRAPYIRKILVQNLDQLQVMYKHGDWLFSHAGFSKLWMREHGLQSPEKANDLLRDNPAALEWVGPEVYGNNPNESPVWIRPNSLIMNALDGFNQCVGHTEIVPEVEPKGIVQFGKKFMFTDTKDHNEFVALELNDD